VHAEDELLNKYVPALHTVQVDALPREKVPALHMVQVEDALPEE